MAIAIDGSSSTDRLEMPDIAAIAGLTEFTVVFTMKLTAASSSTPTRPLFHHWDGNASSDSAIRFGTTDTNELKFSVNSTSNWLSYGEKTTGLNLADGTTYRLGCRFAANKDAEIWNDGVDLATSVTNNNNCTALNDAPAVVALGYQASESRVSLDMEVSEWAMWTEKVPDWVMRVCGEGYSPNMYRTNGLFYCPLKNTGQLIDVWGGRTVTNTGGVDAPHPAMRSPRASRIITGPTPAAGFVPYPNPRYAMNAGMQPMNGGV